MLLFHVMIIKESKLTNGTEGRTDSLINNTGFPYYSNFIWIFKFRCITINIYLQITHEFMLRRNSMMMMRITMRITIMLVRGKPNNDDIKDDLHVTLRW